MKNQRGDKKVITNSISHLKIHDDNGIPLQKLEKNLMNERGDKKMMMMRMSAKRGKIEV
jgi:hypothetical protein